MLNGISISLFDNSKGNVHIEEDIDKGSVTLFYPCSHPNICTPYILNLSQGKYLFELWGAQGGNGTSYGGFGSYTSGILTISNDMQLFLYIGHQGIYNGPSTYNGGGKGGIRCGSGGGATDLRIHLGEWNDFSSLKSRIMVAGGGGGTSSHGNPSLGGHGGFIGYEGNPGIANVNHHSLTMATGGSQTSGGLGGISSDNTDHLASGYDGVFGIGGFSRSITYSCGGGGGYYGGGGGGTASYIVGSGAGGSSYVSGFIGCNSLSESSTENSITHSDSFIHYSSIYFQYPYISSTIGFNSGHIGHGKARIISLSPHTPQFYTPSFYPISNTIYHILCFAIFLTFTL